MSETLEMKINKNTEIVFDFYVDKILSLVKIKNKNVILIGLGNTKFIKFIKTVAKNVCIIDHCLPFERDYKLTDEIQLEIDIKKYLEKNNMPKFDVAIMNPPYDGKLHLEILEKVIPIADKVINISPIDWLMNPYGGSVYNQFKHLKFNSIENVGLIKNIFNLDRASYTGGIYTIDKNANLTPDKFLYKFISIDFKNYIDEKILSSIIKKTIDCDNLENHIVSGEINDKTKYTIVMPKLVGNPGEKTYKLYVRGSRWDKIFYKGLYKGKTASETKKKLKNVKNYTIFDYIEFNTKKEAENWIKSGETNFIKFMQIIQSVDANRRCSHTPYMGDYTQVWDDKRFCEFFNITGYIDDEHAEPGSEWETILNTMKKYA